MSSNSSTFSLSSFLRSSVSIGFLKSSSGSSLSTFNPPLPEFLAMIALSRGEISSFGSSLIGDVFVIKEERALPEFFFSSVSFTSSSVVFPETVDDTLRFGSCIVRFSFSIFVFLLYKLLTTDSSTSS